MMSPVTVESSQRKRRGETTNGHVYKSSSIVDSHGFAPSPKRRKNFMDAFQSISLAQNPQDHPRKVQEEPATAVPKVKSCHVRTDTDIVGPACENNLLPVITSHKEEDDTVLLDDSTDDDNDNMNLLSDREIIERKVMYDLVYHGAYSTTTLPKHPVDAKVEEWVRRDLLRRQQAVAAAAAETTSEMTQDDMNLDHMTVYQKSTIHPSLGPYIPLFENREGRRQRSNSVPVNVVPVMDMEEDVTLMDMS